MIYLSTNPCPFLKYFFVLKCQLCSKLNDDPWNDMSSFEFPEPVTVTLFGKSFFAEVMKVKILRCRGHLEYSKCSLNAMTSVLIKHT